MRQDWQLCRDIMLMRQYAELHDMDKDKTRRKAMTTGMRRALIQYEKLAGLIG